MASFKLLITLLLMICPTNWALSMTSSDSLSVSSKSPLSSSNTKEPSSAPASTAAATLGDLYRKSRQSRCVRCYDDRYGDDYERNRYNPGSGGGGGGSGSRGAISRERDGWSSYPSRQYDERPSASGNWYYPRETNDRYDESRVGYGGSSGGGGGGGGGGRENDRYYYPYNGYYYERNEDRYNPRGYDRYERDRYDSRYSSHDRSPSETRGYGHGYEGRDRYYSSDRSNDYYRGGDRYADRNRGSSGGGIYDRYGQDDRYSRYDYRNYRPWDETYRGQSGFDNSGRGYYFANERPNDYYEPPPPPPPPYGPQSRPMGPGHGPSTPGPTYLPRDPHEQSRPSNSHHGYPDDRPGSSSPSSSSPSSSSGSSASGSDYVNRPRDDAYGHGSGSSDRGIGGGGSGNGGGGGDATGGGGGGDNKNGYTGGSWSYVNDREKDASYKGGIRDKDNQRGQSGFDNSGRGYYFANERPNDYYEPPPPPPPPYGPQSRPMGPGHGPSTPGPTYLPRDPHEQSRPSNSHHGYPDDRPGSSSPSSSSPSSSSGSSASGSDYVNRPRDDAYGHGSGSSDRGIGGGGSGNGGGGGDATGGGGGGDNKNGYTGGSWSYVNDREKDASYKGGIRDKDNQSSPYGGGRGSRPLSGSYLLDRDNNNVQETSKAINPDKPGESEISDSPMASKLTSSPSSSSTSKLTEDRVTDSKDSN